MLIQLPVRPFRGHKGTFGHVLILGGSESMPGAPALSGLAALRSGAGLVTIATSREAHPMTAGYSPLLMTIGLPSRTGRIEVDLAALDAPLRRADVVGVGPGLGQSPALQKLVGDLYQQASQTVVVDADGLNNLAAAKVNWSRHSGPRILTPHPGEFRRILGLPAADTLNSADDDPLPTAAVSFARESGCVLVLKGHRTLVTDGSISHQNTTGNSGLATAGSGDVLTGMIAALVGQGLSPLSAAATGCYLHGRAAELAVMYKTEYGLTAADLFDYFGDAFRELLPPRS